MKIENKLKNISVTILSYCVKIFLSLSLSSVIHEMRI